MWCLFFKNGIVYPIRLVNLAYVIFYVKSIDVESRNTPRTRSGPDHHISHFGWNGLSVRPVTELRV